MKKHDKKVKISDFMKVIRVPKDQVTIETMRKSNDDYFRHKAGKAKKDALHAIHTKKMIAKRRLKNKRKGVRK